MTGQTAIGQTLSLFAFGTRRRPFAEQDIDIGIESEKGFQIITFFNAEEEGELRYKQLLTKRDKETLICLLENRALPAVSSSLLRDNYRFFEDQLKDVDLRTVYTGIQKLKIVLAFIKVMVRLLQALPQRMSCYENAFCFQKVS